MHDLLSIWLSLNLRRRGIIVVATVATFAAVLGLSQIAGRPDMVLLYAGLEPASAGAVIAALDQQGVSHDVSGDSIYVEASRRDSLRMALAAEGLPAAGGGGYELLDQLSGFGTTSQMFDAAYWRAREGELARTILTMPEVRAARIHIARAPARAFQAEVQATASVTLTTTSGQLSEMQARAIRHLVASAVSGMRPEDVQIIDTVSGLIGGQDTTGLEGTDAAARAAAIKGNVERLLAARVGQGKAVVEVSVELVSDREQITERRFDPQGRVAISSETEERSGSSTEPGGQITVASNLPEGDTGGGESGKSQNTETRERINYEVSETQREILRSPGAIRRLTVAVLVDGEAASGADGTRTWQPRAGEEMATLRGLVASAVGLDPGRGDVLTLETLEFQPAPVDGTEATAPGFPPLGMPDLVTMVQTVLLAMVALVLGIFVIRPILTAPKAHRSLAAPGAQLALPAGNDHTGQVLTGEVQTGYAVPAFNAISDFADGADADQATDPASRLRRLIEKRQHESIEILRGWMEQEEERV